MYKVSKKEMHKIAHLFDGWDETLLWSCLQGHMGEAWTNDITTPISARIIVGDFCFLAGFPHKQLVSNIPAHFSSDFILLVPQNKCWNTVIETVHKDNFRKVSRYAIKKEAHIFNRALLQSYIKNIPSEFTLKMIDDSLFKICANEEWSRDLCSQFPSYSQYKKNGLGVMALHQSLPVSGASSYSFYNGGIEIEVDTKREYRRMGLATACCAKLILECLERNLYPSWDAHNLWSVSLAQKLGYNFDKEYTTYIVNNLK